MLPVPRRSAAHLRTRTAGPRRRSVAASAGRPSRLPGTRRRPGPLALALLATIGAAVATTPAPASAATVRPGCADLGAFSGAAHPGACWRPFSAASPFNQRLLPNDPRVTPDSARIVSRFNGFGRPEPMEFGPGNTGEGRGAKPLYYARPGDRQYTIRLTQDRRNGGEWGVNPVNGVTIRIPEGAKPGPAPDRHMVVIDQETGWSYDLWHVQRDARGGGVLQAEWGGRADLDGNGQVEHAYDTASAAGMGVAGGIVRPEELIDGDIPHALYVSAKCTNGRSVFPSTRTADDGEHDCGELGESLDGAPALGQRFQLGYTDAQIAALDVPAHARVLLRAMAHYGFFVIDTTPEAWHVEQEASIDRPALGLPDPGIGFAKDAGIPYWAGGERYVWDIASIPGADGRAGSWTKDLRVIDPCVSAGTCPAPTPVPTGMSDLWPTGSRDHAAPTPVVEQVRASATVTASATVAVDAPASTIATATATASATASAPVLQPAKGSASATKKPSAKDRKKAKAAAKAKAKKRAKALAKAKARKRAKARARARAQARAHRLARGR